MNPVHSTSQLTLDFEPGLAERHESLLACIRQCAYTHRNPLKTAEVSGAGTASAGLTGCAAREET